MSRLVAFLRDTAKTAWGALVGIVVAGLIAYLGWFNEPAPPKPPKPITEQLDELASALSRGPFDVVSRPTSRELHGSGIQSHVYVLGAKRTRYEDTVSDQVRIYDVLGGKLTLRLRYQAQPALGLQFIIQDFVDLDGDGDDELVGSYAQQSEDRVFQYPLVVSWNDALSQYQVLPVVARRPRLAPGAEDDFVVEIHRDAYMSKQNLGTPSVGSDSEVVSYATGPFVVVQGGLRRLLLAAFWNAFEETYRWEMRGWSFYNEGGQARVFSCPGRAFLRPPRDETALRKSMVKAWKTHEQYDCSIG